MKSTYQEFHFRTVLIWLLTAASISLRAADEPHPIPSPAPVPYLSAQESLKKFVLPEGYRLELVLSEPEIAEPVVCAFDGNGRMYVAEMRTYMQDIDGSRQRDPISRISLHVSTRGDGHFDKHTVFVDKLVLPRMILPLADGLLVAETDSDDLYLYRDTDGDGVADKKELVYKGGPRGGNLEHQPSGLIWCMDNWIYTTYNAYRLRINGKNVLKESIPPNAGQWGLTQDDYGKPWFVNAGGEQGPVDFQQPIAYGAFHINDQFSSGFAEVWPLVPIPDVQGGIPRFRPNEKTLNHFTATCGGEIYRGDKLPADLHGDLLFAEPVGRLIRRAKVEVRDGITYLRNAYDKSEFIRSFDPNFRPNNMVTAPDGCLYIVDMYRGIIQEGNWVNKGSYLRNVVQQYSLDKNFGRGRIWRLTYKNQRPGPPPRMLNESPAKLVGHLQHPNGWWRDTAQKLLVLKGDKSVVPALQKMARKNKNYLARMHALWTLEGLDALDPAFIREELKDIHPQVRIAAIRASESLYKKGEQSLLPDLQAMMTDKDPNVVIQCMMTAKFLKWPDATKKIEATLAQNPTRGVQEIGKQLIVSPAKVANGTEFTTEEKKFLTAGENVYKSLCFTCHGFDGKGMVMEGARKGATLAPSLAGAKLILGHRDMSIMVLLQGLIGPVDGKTYDAQMVSMASNNDEWIASVLSYIRNNFGNNAPLINAADVARVRAATKEFTNAWTVGEILTATPQVLSNHLGWKLTASHNHGEARLAIDGDSGSRYTTQVVQQPGMWFQIELPHETFITGLKLDTTKSPKDYPRGYRVEVSSNGMTWDKPISPGIGHGPITDIVFAPTKVKFIKITQTGSSPHFFWSIHELQVYGTGEKIIASKRPKPPVNPYE